MSNPVIPKSADGFSPPVQSTNGVSGGKEIPAWLRQMVLFTVVSGAGVVVDLAVANGVHSLLGLNLFLSSLVGFVSAAIVNYQLHLRCTFRRAGAAVTSSRQQAAYFTSCLLTVSVRWLVLLLLRSIPWERARNLGASALFLAVGVSFVVNFAVCRLWVFRPSGNPSNPS